MKRVGYPGVAPIAEPEAEEALDPSLVAPVIERGPIYRERVGDTEGPREP